MKYIWYRLLWNLAPFLPKGKLLHLDLELNTACNQSCLSCWHNKGFKNETMLIKDAYDHLEWGAKIGLKSVKFNLRGEPLLCNYLKNIVSYAKFLGYVDIMINTNGILLDKVKILELNKAGLTKCIISVDSYDRDTYCTLHNCTETHFKALQENLHTLYEMRNDLKFKVILNFHINKMNLSELPKIVAQLYSKTFKCVVRFTEKRKGKDIALKKKPRIRKKSCPHMKRRITITSNGKFYPCCVCYDEPKDILLNEYMNTDENIIANRDYLIERYSRGLFGETCKSCTSGDIWE